MNVKNVQLIRNINRFVFIAPLHHSVSRDQLYRSSTQTTARFSPIAGKTSNTLKQIEGIVSFGARAFSCML